MRQHRITDPDSIKPSEIKRLVEEGWRVIVQFSRSGYRVSLIEELNELSKVHGRGLEVRFFGHYSEQFDASVLETLPDAMCISVDCLTRARNLETITALANLKELNLGVFELDAQEILSLSSIRGLESLVLGETRKSNIDLSYLRDCPALQRFHTTGHTKNISSITGLPRLTALSLSQIKKKHGLGFVSDMQNLTDLTIILGGRVSISEINAPQLARLEVIRVRGLEDPGDLGRFSKLVELQIEDQIRLEQVALGPNPRLRDIRILNCKGLKELKGVETLQSLEQIRISKTAIDYEAFISRTMPASLKVLAFYTGKRRIDEPIQKDLASRGYRESADGP